MDNERKTVISKTLSRLLRHNPGDVVLIDARGFTGLAMLLAHMRTLPPFSTTGLAAGEVMETVGNDGKGRFEIEGGRIRARSGHSFPVSDDGEPYVPSGPLFFGTVGASRAAILEHGMTMSSKLKVRLSRSYDEALRVAEARPGDDPFIVEVDAERLAADGWTFGLLPNGEVVTDHFGSGYVSVAQAPAGGRMMPGR